MYTYNLFCFGHELSKDPILNNSIWSIDIDIKEVINKRKWEVYFPYHGGQCKGDTFSCVFGINITDDDGNSEYVKTIRTAKKEDYIEDYEKFLELLMIYLEKIKDEEPDEEIIETIERLKKFLIDNDPDFYSVEASS